MGLYLNDAAMLVKINHGYLLFFGKPCSHKTSWFSQTMRSTFHFVLSADLPLFQLLTAFSWCSVHAAFQPLHQLIFHHQFAPADPLYMAYGMRTAELFQCFQTFLRFFEKSRNGWDRIDLRQLYLKAVNKSIAFRDGKK